MKKKLFNQSFILFTVGILVGAFYREFTKFVGFSGVNSMAFVHTHLIATGALVALIFCIFFKAYNIEDNKPLNRYWTMYLVGVVGNAVILFTRGLLTILNVEVSRALSMSISGVAGIIHITLTIGIIMFFLTLKKQIKN